MVSSAVTSALSNIRYDVDIDAEHLLLDEFIKDSK